MQKIIMGVCLGAFSTCWGMISEPNDETDDLSYSIESRFHLHVPSLLFLAAKDLTEDSIQSLPYQSIRDYAARIKKVHYKYVFLGEKPSPDFPDNAFYMLNKFKVCSKIIYQSKNIYKRVAPGFNNQPYTRKALITHGVSFHPEYQDLKDIRQDIPDNPSQALYYVQNGDISPQCALIKAACLDHPETIKELVIWCAFSDFDKKKAFNAAVEHNSPMCCQALFDTMTDFINEPFREGDFCDCYFIDRAVLHQCRDSVKFLLEHKSNLNVKSSLLLGASVASNIEMVRLLLEHGAKVNKEALEFAGYYSSGNLEEIFRVRAAIIRELVKHGGDIGTLRSSQQKNYRELLAKYPEEGEDVTSSSAGQSCLDPV